MSDRNDHGLGGVRRFEDLVAWQRARKLMVDVHQVTKTGEIARDYDLVRQLRRSALSVMSNIAEGYERGRPSEFHHFLSIAKGSCGELRSQLYVALDVGYLKHEAFEALAGQAHETSRIIGGLRTSVARYRRNNTSAT